MQQLLPLKAKIWIVVGLAAVISSLARLAGLDPLSLGTVVGAVEFVTIHLLMRSWTVLRYVSALPLPAWARVDLSGEWQGVIHSQWKRHPDDPPLAPIPATLELHQGWQEIVFSLKTEKMRSRSSGAVPSFDPTTRELRFRYFFETEPMAESTSENPPQQLGSALAWVNLDHPDRLTIKYTNERGPGGDITLQRAA
jgi:hypothetical protein